MEYVTAEEKARLETELRERISKRGEISRRIGEARELGDLKENGEYHAAREDQGMNEARIKQLEDRLSRAVVVDPNDMPSDTVFIGATVRLRDVENGREELYRLVGDVGSMADDHDAIAVTPASPLGEALLQKRLGEVVKITLRKGPRSFEVVEITR